jgi:UDP-glucose 4-epimerase
VESLDVSEENWLITGGLGYIGAHVARELIKNGCKVVLIDNLTTGLLSRKPDDCVLVEGDVRDSNLVRKLCQDYKINGVIHLASFKHARESRLNPLKYWANNVGGTLGLVQGIEGTNVSKVIFSSSCSIYGDNSEVLEGSVDKPISTYAQTKKVSEDILVQSLTPQNIALVNLRFFNVIGCDSFLSAHDVSQECLVPVIANHFLNKTPFRIFGTTHPTKDGTCLRDYIDVRDLARAHALFAKALGVHKVQTVVNVSTGIPISVLQVLKEFEKVAGRGITHISMPADPADPIAIWAQQSKTLGGLGWIPEFNLSDSIKSHWLSVTQSPG